MNGVRLTNSTFGALGPPLDMANIAFSGCAFSGENKKRQTSVDKLFVFIPELFYEKCVVRKGMCLNIIYQQKILT